MLAGMAVAAPAGYQVLFILVSTTDNMEMKDDLNSNLYYDKFEKVNF